MRRPSYLFLLPFLVLLLACEEKINEPASPNVLLILTDDQGYGDINIHLNDSIETPWQNLLASEGLRMDNFIVSPVCAPTRASLLTGRYHYRTGTSWVTRNAETMRSEELTLAEVFKTNHYSTGCFGKWHNGSHYPEHPLGQGFDEFTGFCAGHWNNYFDPMLESNGSEYQASGYITDILTDSAMSFMLRNKDNPFFCYLPYNTPHTPYIVPEELFQKYKAKGLSDKIACSYGMVESIDNNIGRMLGQLEDLNILDNTIVIFITDNGPNYNRFNGGMKGRKGWVNDGGVRVPCFIYWKDHIKEGKVSKALTSHIDLLPTLVDWLELEKPEGKALDGKSFASILRNEADTLPDRNVFTFHVNQQGYKGSVRNNQFRLVINGEDDYTLTKFPEDIGEENDLTDDHPQTAAILYQEYLRMYDEVTRDLEEFPPITLGYAEAPTIHLPAHEGFIKGNVSYKASKWGWANDWFVNWKSETDTMFWKLNSVEQGSYSVHLKYTAAQEGVGTKVQIHSALNTLTASVDAPFTPEVIPNQDIVPREAEAKDQSWGMQELGIIKIPQGRSILKMNALQINGDGITEVKGLILKRVPNPI